jgi:AAA+ ATPase superfamily predicted ATPase
MKRPSDLFDREREWQDLAGFVGGADSIRIGVMYGRRRQGKSWILRRLVRAAGGVYTMALEHDRLSALGRFARAVAEASGIPGARLQMDDWEEALRTARTVLGNAGQRVLVLDEYPYLLRHSPELSSVLQALYDEMRDDPSLPPLRILLCGSAISIMEELLSGASPLRGRTQLEMRMQPFDYRTSARFWGADDPELAFLTDAVFGGTAGYRDLVQVGQPSQVQRFSSWLSETVLNPSSALFTEADFLLREDPRIQDRAPYYAILQAASEGKSSPTAIGGAVGRERTSLSHPLGVLISSGYLVSAEDVRKQRNASLRVADPIVRFHHVITRPRLSQFEERRFENAWKASLPTFKSLILGPHFEHLAREWVRLFASEDTLGGAIGEVGFTTISDRHERQTLEVDVIGLASCERRHNKSSKIICIGEAKSSDRERTLHDLRRLDRVRGLLEADGADCAGAKLLLFGRSGFDENLKSAAAGRRDVELVDLSRIYEGD